MRMDLLFPIVIYSMSDNLQETFQDLHNCSRYLFISLTQIIIIYFSIIYF